MAIARDKKSGWWYVKDFIDEHDHPLATRGLACLLHLYKRINHIEISRPENTKSWIFW